ncbi:P-loop NTPase [bacterium]|nr:P-loop NTPase [bacterium]
MKIAIASGKGGTGKTTVTTNLAVTVNQMGKTVHVLDCDVEEPNCHIFLKPAFHEKKNVSIPVPLVNKQECIGCGLCAEVCQFNAIAFIKGNVLVFPELCHGCGGCWLLCPQHAIGKSQRVVGTLEKGTAHGFPFSHGNMKIGEAMAPPLIKAVKETANGEAVHFIDSPPGTSCPVIESIHDSEFVVLVTEPTPFGLNDLVLAVEMVRELKLPFGVVINRAGSGDDAVEEYCRGEQIDILMQLPDNRQIAEAYSRGDMAVDVAPEIRQLFENLYKSIQEKIQSS